MNKHDTKQFNEVLQNISLVIINGFSWHQPETTAFFFYDLNECP